MNRHKQKAPRSFYERKHEPLLPRRLFFTRVVQHMLLGGGTVFTSLTMGVIGYHHFAGLRWVDALENAAMILAGMGPLIEMPNDTAKIFASCYALFSGIVFISSVGVMVAPAVHRVLHHFHITNEEK